MQNVNITVSKDGKTATIVINLDERLGLSSTGKSNLVASTGGNKPIPGTKVMLGLNAYIPVDKAK